MFNRLGEQTFLQLIFVGILMLGSLVVLYGGVYALGIGIWGEDIVESALSGVLEQQEQLSFMKSVQLAYQLSIFVIPALALHFILNRHGKSFFGLTVVPSWKQISAILILFVTGLPFIQWSIDFNGNLHLPEFLAGVEDWMIEKENLAGDVTDAFLSVNTWGAFAFNLLILAILPAIGEELLFRGLLMNWFKKLTGNIHVNILITAFIFSAIHMQFFGFLPRFILGILLGYAYHYTQSLWAPILLHFVNNAFTTTIYFWTTKNELTSDPESMGGLEGFGFIMLSLISVLLTMSWLYFNRNEEVERSS